MISIQLVGQDTKKVRIFDESPPFTETFYVLKNDKTIKHGEYTKTYGGRLIKGKFDNNKRVGVWEYLDEAGQPEMKIDFDHKKVLFSAPFNFISKVMVADGDSFKEVIPEEKPIFFGGRGNILYYLLGLQYPVEARRKGIEGTVVISATITTDGRIVDEKIEAGAARVLNDEALRVIQKMPDEWFPGKINGENVDMRIFIPVKFKLS